MPLPPGVSVNLVCPDFDTFKPDIKKFFGFSRRQLLVWLSSSVSTNSIAKTMRSGHFGAVTLLFSSEQSRSWLPEPLLIGIHIELAQHDLHLSIPRLSDEQLHNE